MGEIGVSAFKWSIKLTYALASVVFLIVFIALAVSAIGVALNGSMVLDLMYFIQMWLPFNLNPLFVWLFTSVTAFFSFRLSMIGFNILNRVLN